MLEREVGVNILKFSAFDQLFGLAGQLRAAMMRS